MKIYETIVVYMFEQLKILQIKSSTDKNNNNNKTHKNVQIDLV